MNQFNDKPKCSCIQCRKEIYVMMLNKHMNACDKKHEKFNNMVFNVDYVICGICNKKLLENNNDHLKTHNISTKDYDLIYKNFPRISAKGIEGKNHFKNGVSGEMSANLKKSHTLEGYIEKYGEIEGSMRYYNMKIKKSTSKTLEGYIEKYGEIEGSMRYNDSVNNKKTSKDNFIKKYGENVGNEKYIKMTEKMRFNRTLDGYIHKFGEEIGYLLWIERNENHSKSMTRHRNGEFVNKIKEYCLLVERITRISFNKFKDNIDPEGLRSKEFHLDHRVSKCYGFLNKIHPIYIGSKYNLEIKTSRDNTSKQDKNDISPDVLKEFVDIDEFYLKMFNNFGRDFFLDINDSM